jgi:hypothetical protein
MIMDAQLLFDGPTPVALTTTRDSTNVLDFGVQRDMGIGTPLYLMITTAVAFGAGAMTCTISVQGSPDNSSYLVYAQTPALTVTQMNLPLLFPITLPRPPYNVPPATRPRYYKLVYTVASGPFTTGTLIAGLVAGRDDVVYYPSGFSTTYI